jgi:invasion protein IalB
MIRTRHLLPMSLFAIAFCLAFAPMAIAQRQAAPPPAAGGEGQPTMLGQYGDWGAYTGMSGGRKVCFALGKPASSQTNPPNRPRDPAYLFVSSRPADNVRNEVSVVIGYPFKPSSEATAEIDTAKFVMYTQNDGAWIKNAADETRLVDAMRKGANLIVKGTSGRGTETTDRYSLKGLAQAVDRVNQECR